MNVATPFGAPSACLDRDWLEHRFSLFEHYTLPSVMAQRGAAPFTWLLFSHPDTPPDFKSRLESYARKMPCIRIEWRAEFDGVSAGKAVERLLRPETRRVITSRMDNDDAIARSYMAVVQAEAAKPPLIQGSSFINFDLGYHLHAGAVYHAEHRANPYCSLVEDREGLRGVYTVKHEEMASLYPVVHVRNRRPWLTVIHERNAVNQVDGIRCRSTELLDEFSWLPPGEVVPYGRLSILARRARTAARLVASNVKKLTAGRRGEKKQVP